MATCRIKFSASSVSGKEGTLHYQVIHNRVVRQIQTGHRIFPSEWDVRGQTVVLPQEAGSERHDRLLSVRAAMDSGLKRLTAVIGKLEDRGLPYTADDVVKSFVSSASGCGLASFAREIADRLRAIGKRRLSETYATAVSSFMRFRKGRDVLLGEMDSDLMSAYAAYLADNGVCPNTVSFYMRNLRAIYNRAVDKGLTVQRSPFKHVYTGIDKTVKRAVPIDIIRQIRSLDLSLHPAMDYARDIFMFSFYTRGMSFVDIAFLKKKDLADGILSYRRHKTRQQLFIKWEKPMQELIDKYDTSSGPYLLPVIKDAGNDERTQYLNEAHRVNRNLKKIGRLLGLPMPLTSYVARHGWASIAKSKNIPIATISEAMGHDSENTTRIYLASLDTSVVDNANSLILQSL